MFAFSQAALIFTLKLSCNANPACFLSLSKKTQKNVMKNKKGSELLKTRPLSQSWSCAAEASWPRWPMAARCRAPRALLWRCSVCELLLPLLQRQQSCASPVQLKGCACVVVLQHSHLILSVQIKESGSESG